MGTLKKFTDPILRAINGVPFVNRKLGTLASHYLAIHQAPNYDSDINGERWLLETIQKQTPMGLCFDVGANRGGWVQMILSVAPETRVHCFELSSPTYEFLAKRFGNNPQVVLNAHGLSNQAETVTFKHCHDGDGLTSMIEVVSSKNTEEMTGRVMRGLDYCMGHKIEKIDFLKIDVEGAENLVLEGFGELIRPELVPVIQFEYGYVNIVSKFLLRDFYAYFEGRGYRIGKLCRDHVDFSPYGFHQEDFIGPNYIAAAPQYAAWLGA
ncbi:FkbM family methyltransferase [Cerasicoccus arenae]|uniref:Nodulation protein noeI-methyltransferase n=1 Tax=Cerasicoccus arenae TaxID=424488 RepID=A0A8J3DDC0_9BACT|nr:FkbM family methyltransferase [Cerasicoccus arenae]MBK1857156.1 FkbM family methyltransferase [Cerasicoccus arenae]GHB92677.1 nodulation protein noeI- methyltransferase [Cerasicoccus arenae]